MLLMGKFMANEHTIEKELLLFLTAAQSHLDSMRTLLEGSNVFIRSSDHRDMIIGAHLSE